MNSNLKKLALSLITAAAFTSTTAAFADEHMHSTEQQTANKQAPVKQSVKKTAAKKELYTCPMHKDYVSEQPGKCPKCHMTLVKKDTGSSTSQGK